MRRTINDLMWHFCIRLDGRLTLVTHVQHCDVWLMVPIPETPEYESDVWMWCERMQVAIWGIFGASGVFPDRVPP